MTLRLTQIFFFLLPLLFAVSSLIPLPGNFDIHTARLFPLLLLISLFWEAGATKKKIYLPLSTLSIALLTLFLWSILSLFYSDVPTWTARKLFFLLTFAPLLVVLPNLWRWHHTEGVTKTLASLVFGAALISLVGIIQFVLQFFITLDGVAALWSQLTPFFLGSVFSDSVATFNSWYVHVAGRDLFRAIAFFPDPHIFAYFTGMTLPLAYGLYRLKGSRFLLISTLLILTVNILTFSRGGEVALFGGIIMALLLEWPRLKLPHKHGLFALLLIILITLLLPSNPLTNRFISSFDAKDTSNSSRIVLWQEALETIGASPVIGVGLGAYPIHVDPRADYRTPIYAHNTYLDIAVETGLVGLLLFIISLFAAIRTFFLNRTQLIARYAMISVSIFLIHGLFDTPIFSVHIFPLLLLIFSLAFFFYDNDARTRA